ncbi:sodium/nucleoside cotransporter [Plakobranchus ocellatus]|uniref:Sodium/nucleoside cotransporter n=1 Tax=Plakobranchus ocellatus TaxID=259542 RepID=A0AAV4AQ16_9GAST|nr:sodium/nucleoside cotransporter [Plakobranchus ocellatus]
MSDHLSSTPAEVLPESEPTTSTFQTEGAPSLASSAVEATVHHNADGFPKEQVSLLSDTDAPPAYGSPTLPERRPVLQGNDSLPPPPPVPVAYTEPDSKKLADNEQSVATPADSMKRKSGFEDDVQLEMDELNDPTLVAIVQANADGKKIEGASLGGYPTISEKAPQHGMGSFFHRDEDNAEETQAFDDQDLDDRDRKEQAWQEANILSRAIILLQRGLTKIYQLLIKLSQGYLWTAVFLIGFMIYLAFALRYEFGDEGSYRLVVCTVLAIIIFVWPYVKRFVVTTAKKSYGSDTLSDKHSNLLQKVKFVFRWFGDEGSYRLVVCTVLAIIIFVWPYVKRFVVTTAKKSYGSDTLSDKHSNLLQKVKFVFRWIMYFVMTGIMVYTLVDEAKEKPKNMRGLPGLFVFLLIALLFSSRPSKIKWHTIFWSVALQFVCAFAVLKWQRGKDAFIWLQDRFDEFFENTHRANFYIFGESWRDHLFVFGAMPLLWFSNAVFTVLYYLGAMQIIIGFIGTILKYVTGVSPLEAMSISAGIFMEGVTNLIVMRPFLSTMTKSQLFAVITGCMSSLGGGYLGLLAALGIPLEFIVPAMLVSAPATFAICKLMVPETLPETAVMQGECKDLCAEEKKKYSNVFDALQTGAISMLVVCGNLLVIGHAFLSFITWINHTLEWFGDRVGVDGVSIEFISSYLLYPVALAMGVEAEDCRRVATMLGYRIGIYNILAFFELTTMKRNKMVWFKYMTATNFTGPVTHDGLDIKLNLWNVTLNNGFLSDRSEAIATYSLCGFSSAVTAMMLVSVVFAVAPKRKKWISGIALKALVAGNLANCMTGCFASKFAMVLNRVFSIA